MFKKKQVVVILSIALICFLVGTSVASDGGSPWNKVWTAISELQSETSELRTNYNNLMDDFIDLRTDYEELKENLTMALSREPDYDSGWIEIALGEISTLTHNLNTTRVFVYIIGKSELLKIHQRGYSIYDSVHWYELTDKTIKVRRHTPADYWDFIRVMLWIIQEPPT